MATETDALVLSISADTTSIRNELKRLMRDSRTATDQMSGNFDRIGRAANSNIQGALSKSFKAAQADAQNLRYQLNDIATGLASGQSPFMVLSQQGGQLSQILSQNGGGLGASFKMIASAATSMINPINLAIVAVGGLAWAWSRYGDQISGSSGESLEALKKEQDAIAGVIAKWGDMVPALKQVYDQRQAIIDQRAVEAAGNIEKAGAYEGVAADFKDARAAIGGIISDLRQLDQNTAADELSAQFEHVSAAIKNNSATVADVTKLIELLQEASKSASTEGLGGMISMLQAMLPKLQAAQKSVQAINEDVARATAINKAWAEMLKNVDDALDLSKTKIDALGKSYEAFQATLGRGSSVLADYANQQANLARNAQAGQAGGTAEFIRGREGFISKAKWDRNHFRVGFGSDTYVDEMGKVREVTESTTVTIEQAWEDLGRRIGEFQRKIVSQIGPDFWASFDDSQRTALTSIAYNYGSLPDRIVTAIQTGDKGKVAQAIADLGTDNKGINAKRRQMEAELFGGSDFSASAKTAAMSFKELLDDASRGTAVLTATGEAMQSVAGSTDDYGYAVARARKEQELLNKAQEENIPLTDAMKAQISAAADAYGRAEQAINKQKAAAKDSARDVRKNAQEWQQLGSQLAGIGSNAVSGLVQDLRNGVSAGEAFRNMLSKIADELLSMALNQTFKALFGSIFSGIGGAGGGFNLGAGATPIMHSGGTAGFGSIRRQVSPGLFLGAPRYHSGTPYAGLRPGEVPAILQRGEVVMPRGSAGGTSGSTTVGDINIDMSASGYVAADTAGAKQFGENVRKYVQIEMVRQSRPGGLLRKVPTP